MTNFKKRNLGTGKIFREKPTMYIRTISFSVYNIHKNYVLLQMHYKYNIQGVLFYGKAKRANKSNQCRHSAKELSGDSKVTFLSVRLCRT